MNQTNGKKKEMTGYPSIDKPWLKYYSEEAISKPLPQCTMYDYIWQKNKDYPNDIALRYYGTKISYKKMFDNIRKVAASFLSMGIKEGDIVTIMSMHTPETIYSIYALNYLGAIANMVYITLSEKEIVDTLNNTDSQIFLVLDTILERIEAIAEKIKIPIIILGISDSMPLYYKSRSNAGKRTKEHNYILWKNFIKKGAAVVLSPMFIEHSSPAVIVYTSGTTGKPKGVMLSNDNINSLIFQFLVSGFNFGRKEIYLHLIPTFFGYGLGMISIAIAAGLDTTLWIELDPVAVSKEIDYLKPNHIEIGVAFIDEILDGKHGDMSQLINFASGGGSISIDKEREVNAFLKQHDAKNGFIMGYGMTEFASSVCNNLHHATKEGSVGVPLPRANVKILDTETKKELPYGEIGEICFNAPNMMMCYFEQEEETNAIIHFDETGNRWLSTGDLGYVDTDGFIFFKGRKKRISYTRMGDGTIMRLFPQRIEEFFETRAFVEKCAVITIEDKSKINIPIAFLTIQELDINKEEFIVQLNKDVRSELPEHLQVGSVHILDTMPMTSNGKIDYHAKKKWLVCYKP